MVNFLWQEAGLATGYIMRRVEAQHETNQVESVAMRSMTNEFDLAVRMLK